jgi:hypothetical protein
VLLEARPHLEKQFGRDAIVELRIPPRYERYYDTDPEFSEDLFATVLTRLDPETTLALMNRFWEEWWAEEADRHRDYPLDVDYAGDDEKDK